MTAYYNEIDPHAAEWLRNLIKAGHIAAGDVDSRSIADVRPADLAGYTQCHFFAGIGVWSYALRLAGWPDDRPVWTGSCPCQPFSAAGKGKGGADDRHLWPVWFNLIRECKPVCVFGEQVESAIRHGWLDLVQADMEGVGYAFAPVGLPAAGFGAPHIRQRLWFVADAAPGGFGINGSAPRSTGHAALGDGADLMGDAERARLEGLAGHGHGEREQVASGSVAETGDAGRPGPTNGHWRDADWIFCRDGKWRPVEPGTFPLAHGIAGRVGLLRGYGNAIVAQVAAEVIGAFMEVNDGQGSPQG